MILRRLVGADEPQETRVFLVVAAFGLVIAVIYWFVSYEVAGTVLLLAFGVATAAIAVALVRAPGAAVVRRRRRAEPMAEIRAGREDVGGGGGTGDVDRPFLDEAGRMPAETLGPFAVGLGAAMAATGPIFGLAPVIVGLLPFAWGAWTWLSGAREELDAAESDIDAAEAATAARTAEEDALPVEATPDRASRHH